MLDTVKRKSCGLAAVGLVAGMTFVAATPANAINVSGDISTDTNILTYSSNSSSTVSPMNLPTPEGGGFLKASLIGG